MKILVRILASIILFGVVAIIMLSMNDPKDKSCEHVRNGVQSKELLLRCIFSG